MREYCLFYVKKIFQIFNLKSNLDIDGWDYDPDQFKAYFQNVIYNPNYKVLTPKLKGFDIDNFSRIVLIK